MEPTILYEDAHIVVVNKPAGVMTHPDGKTKEKTISDWFVSQYPESRGVGEVQILEDGTELLRPGVVHRLDKETSGVLILTKTQDAHTHLKQAFGERRIKKTYAAFVYGVPKEERGVIEFSIGRSRKDFRLRSAQPKARGRLREAITRYEVKAIDPTRKHSFIFCYPETGRTHQIRVHLKAIHHPVVCDPLYAPNHPCALGFSRLALHAYKIEIPQKDTSSLVIEAPLPQEFVRALDTSFGGDVAVALA